MTTTAAATRTPTCNPPATTAAAVPRHRIAGGAGPASTRPPPMPARATPGSPPPAPAPTAADGPPCRASRAAPPARTSPRSRGRESSGPGTSKPSAVPSSDRTTTNSKPTPTPSSAASSAASASTPSTPVPNSMARRPWTTSAPACRSRSADSPRQGRRGGADHRAATHQPPRLVEQCALGVLQHRDLARPPAFRRRRLQHDPRATVRVRRRELDRLLAAQAERRFQPPRHPDQFVLHQRQLLRRQVAAFVLVGHVRSRPDPVARVVLAHDVGLADLPRPPAQRRHPVLHRADGQPPPLPLGHQRLDVLALQAPGAQAAVAPLVQRVRHLRERVGPVAPGAVRAVALALLQLQQVPVQLAHGAPADSCPLRPRCTTDTHRRISRNANEIVMDRMAERLAAGCLRETRTRWRQSLACGASRHASARACRGGPRCGTPRSPTPSAPRSCTARTNGRKASRPWRTRCNGRP